MKPGTERGHPGKRVLTTLWATSILKSVAGHPILPMIAIGLIGIADYMTGWEFSFAAFYLAAILLIAYRHSRAWVLASVALSSLCWLLVEKLTHPDYSLPWAPYWNMAVRMVMFGTAGLLLHQVRELHARERRLVRFLVHDLRNPLTALSLSIQRLANLHSDSESATILENCEHVLRRSRELIDGILAQGEERDAPILPRKEAFPLQSTVYRVQHTFRTILDQFAIQIAEAIPTEPITVVGDPALTERVVENVLGNALKVSPKGSTITIQVFPDSDGFVNLRILDEGPGIPPGLVDTLFDPYVTGGEGHEALPKGMGLGLAFCRSAMRAQGGRIWVEGPEDGGAAVTISLPAHA